MSKTIHMNTIDLPFEQAPIPEYNGYSSEDISKIAGQKEVSSYVCMLKKGQYSCPYHFHHNAEEIFVILEGKGQLRTPGKIQIVEKGDSIFFEKGKNGAHQLKNDQNEDLVYLDIKVQTSFDVCEYPDTGKVNLIGKEIFEKGKPIDYFAGEESLKEIWNTWEKS